MGKIPHTLELEVPPQNAVYGQYGNCYWANSGTEGNRGRWKVVDADGETVRTLEGDVTSNCRSTHCCSPVQTYDLTFTLEGYEDVEE